MICERSKAASLVSAILLLASLTAASAARADNPVRRSERPHAPAAARPLDDATIVAIFDAANSADIETGNLAATRGASAEVREFGKMLSRDHTHVRQLGRDLAAKLHVTPTPPADQSSAKAHAEAMTKLRALKGAAFDHAFLQHEVAFHQGVIDAVTSTLLPAIQNAELKTLVTTVAPAFEAHRAAAKSLDDKLSSGRATPTYDRH